MAKKVYVVTGPKGSGKSTAVANFAPPIKEEYAKLLVVDNEDSMNDIVEENARLGVEFKLLRAYERFKIDDDMLSRIAQGKLPWVSGKEKNALIDYWLWFTHTLDETLKAWQFKYIGIDTVEPVEAAMTAWAEHNKQASGWSGIRAYGRLEVEAVRPLYTMLFEAAARRGVEAIILSSHLKPVWEELPGGKVRKVLNKVQVGGRMALLSQISNEMFWLVPNVGNPDGAPAALVLKARRGIRSIVDGRWVDRRVLPQRVPHFTWDDVRAYDGQPANLVQPALGETPTVEEREMMSEFMTDEQMRLMVLGAETALEEMRREEVGVITTAPNWQPGIAPGQIVTSIFPVPADRSRDEEIAALWREGLTPPEIGLRVSRPLPVVLRVVNTLKANGEVQPL